MKPILVSQRVESGGPEGLERRDALDQAWLEFLHRCGLGPVLLPNHPEVAAELLRSGGHGGLLLTGGNTLAVWGGDAPERDAVETMALLQAMEGGLPVVGVCRGMQMLLEHFDVPQRPLEGHVQERQTIQVEGRREAVNSYHRFGTDQACGPFEIWARADDGVVKAVRHRQLSLTGIMWHPERMRPFRDEDLQLFRRTFTGDGQAEKSA